MKKILFAVLSFVVISAQAQTVEEVISKYTKGMGGLDAFNKVGTAKITGTYSVQGNDIPFTIQIINGKAMRSDLETAEQAFINVYYNGIGWKSGFDGTTTAIEVTGSELTDFKTQSYLANHLMAYKARGHQVELQGEETLEGIKTYKIKLISKDDGKATTYFISTADHTLIKSVTNRDIQGQSMEVESWYSDLKEFAGIKFFMTRDSKIDGQTFQTVKYVKVELNVPMDEKIFAK